MEPLSAAILGGAALAGSGITALSTKKPSSSTHLAKLNFKYGKLYDEWAAKNMPRFNREGMEAAGFNPILAITAGQAAHGMANTPGHGAYDASGGAGSELASGIASAVNAYYDLAQKKENVALTKEETKLKEAQTKLTDFQREHPGNPLQALGAQGGLFDKVGDWIGKKIGNFQGWRLNRRIEKARSSSSASGNYHNRNNNRNNIYIHFGGSGYDVGPGSSANSIIGPVNSDY